MTYMNIPRSAEFDEANFLKYGRIARHRVPEVCVNPDHVNIPTTTVGSEDFAAMMTGFALMAGERIGDYNFALAEAMQVLAKVAYTAGRYDQKNGNPWPSMD